MEVFRLGRPSPSNTREVVKVELALEGCEALHPRKVEGHDFGLEPLNVRNNERSPKRHNKLDDVFVFVIIFGIH